MNGYCKDRVGSCFIERGDYQVLRAEDSQVIGPSEFATTVKSGMVLELSIVMHQTTSYQEECPRCGHINSGLIASEAWVVW